MRLFTSAIAQHVDGTCDHNHQRDTCDIHQKQILCETNSTGQSRKYSRITCPQFKIKRNVHDAPRINQYALYVNEKLSPRSSGWLYIFAISIVGVSSLHITDNALTYSDNTVLTCLLSTSSIISFTITLFYHHRDLRELITKDIPLVHNSLEFILSMLIFGTWCTILRYATDLDLKFDTNFWVCTWLGFGLSSYLVGSLIMASPLRRMGVISTVCGFPEDVQLSLPCNHVRSDGRNNVHAAYDDILFWFMLLAFSSALAVFSILTRTGDACSSGVDASAFCKRSTLGGVTGIICALLALTAIFSHRVNTAGTFHHWESKKKFSMMRTQSVLPYFALAFQTVNMGFGTNGQGPSTVINNTYVTSLMGVILSLILCEQSKDRSMSRLMPCPTHGIESRIDTIGARVDDTRKFDADGISSSSSSRASSLSALAASIESSSECAVVTSPIDGDGNSRAVDEECGSISKSYSSRNSNSTSYDPNDSTSSSVYSSSDCSSNNPATMDTYSTHTAPRPAVNYLRSLTSPQPRHSFEDVPYPPMPSTAMYRNEKYPIDNDSKSFVELSFQPNDDDVSSIGFSTIPGEKLGREPDGFKYDDLYIHSDGNLAGNSDLAPVNESTVFMSSKSMSNMNDRMNRGVDKIAPNSVAYSQDDENWTDSELFNHDEQHAVNSIGNSIVEI